MSSKLQVELKQSKPFSHLEEELFLSLVRTVDLLGRAVADLLKEYDLSSAQYNVLRILRGAGEQGLPCGEVGVRMVTRDPDITRLLDRLEKRNLVARERAAADRRIIVARITPPGAAVLEKIDQPLQDLHQRQLGHLDRAAMETIIGNLAKIRQALKETKD